MLLLCYLLPVTSNTLVQLIEKPSSDSVSNFNPLTLVVAEAFLCEVLVDDGGVGLAPEVVRDGLAWFWETSVGELCYKDRQGINWIWHSGVTAVS